MLIALLCMANLIGAQSTIYVNGSATGANNGSSWADAFVSLDAGLAAAVAGDQVWVADGVYKPSTAAPNHTFSVLGGISLYGSFAGTETAISQRNIAANASVLSGDIVGDDIDNDFVTNRSDNSVHVVRARPGAAGSRVVIDGFTIRNGSTLLGASDPAAMKRGAGLFVETAATVENCTFQQNYADSGSGLMAGGVASNGLLVKSCIFEGNGTFARGAGMYVLSVIGVQVLNCTFRDNKTLRGCLYPRTCSNVLIDGCTFEYNLNETGFGAGIYSLETTYTISNCSFKGNSATSAASIYLENQQGGNVVTVRKCTFEENVTTGYGGSGLYAFAATYTADSCIFLNNEAPSSAAAIYNGGTSNFTVKNSLMEGNTGNYAAAVANYTATGIYENCIFRKNIASNGGGAASNGFKSAASYKNCTFSENEAAFGGAIFTQNDTTRLSVDGCTFESNISTGSGAAIFKNSNIDVRVRNTAFRFNNAASGAGIFARGDSTLWVENCQFVDNIVSEQGTAVNLSNTNNAVFINTLMAVNNNYNTDTGAGGALINNASEGVTSKVTMTNCTIVDNFSPLGPNLAQWEDDTSNAVMILQNCLIQNSIGDNYFIEAGEPEVISNGGNQSSDASFSAYFTQTKDKNNTTNAFVDPSLGVYNFRLLQGPAVNGGVAAGAPTTDLDGNARTGDPDVGAYEFMSVGSYSPDAAVAAMLAAPNPASAETLITLDAEWTGDATLQVIGTDGALLRSIQVNKNSQNWQYRLPLQDLPTGNYQVYLRAEGHAARVALVKQ
jgi:predicted outer membrane repeat protein